ncbi:LOW QUALITY PROTEIN: fibronectin type III domain-containing protein 9 [Sorex fumeus]|uniref:LOW QUALITY PROTEIN: fibronectin type III domain-containing protein 9 n=1 Tax=Sorex fumeus TaxID=62283 RepID=UPI0024AD2212|nr:LOW QUALITY PROTEIN: fibronectin type III domain-containing protein 9 [Sorex fumeus]
MNLEVGNVSCTGALVSWSSSEPCLEDFYHVAYRPSWQSVFSGYLRHGPQHEERVPRAVGSLALRHLAPATLYFLCVSCQRAGADPHHHCTVFHTLEKKAPAPTLADPQLSLWVLLAVLLVCLVAVLAFVCLQFWCVRSHEPRWAYRAGRLEEANGLVRWPEEVPALGLREEDIAQELALAELGLQDPRPVPGPGVLAMQLGRGAHRGRRERGARGLPGAAPPRARMLPALAEPL